jgi:hypothetical protein
VSSDDTEINVRKTGAASISYFKRQVGRLAEANTGNLQESREEEALVSSDRAR